jgi:hypothetical protein
MGALNSSLLHDVRQLVRQEAQPLRGRGTELACPEDHVRAHGVRPCIQRRRRRRGRRVGVKAHATEIAAETPLYPVADGGV